MSLAYTKNGEETGRKISPQLLYVAAKKMRSEAEEEVVALSTAD